MNKKEFIKLIRELQKLQIKVVDKEYLSIDINLGRAKPTTYIGFYLFIYDTESNIKELYSKTLYNTLIGSTESKDNTVDIINKNILEEIKKKVAEAQLLYGGRKRSEAERSDAPIK